jgi:hypothetical protein
MVSRRRVFTVLAQVAVPKRWPAQELHLRDARDVRHNTTTGTLHPRTASLDMFQSDEFDQSSYSLIFT